MRYQFLESFYQPSLDQTRELMAACRKGTAREAVYYLPEPFLELAREDIALRLWNYLAGLARAYIVEPAAVKEGQAVIHLEPEIRAWIVADLGRDLALEDDAAEQASELLSAFLHWLGGRPGHRFDAPWGRMSVDGDTLRFTEVRIPQRAGGRY